MTKKKAAPKQVWKCGTCGKKFDRPSTTAEGKKLSAYQRSVKCFYSHSRNRAKVTRKKGTGVYRGRKKSKK